MLFLLYSKLKHTKAKWMTTIHNPIQTQQQTREPTKQFDLTICIRYNSMENALNFIWKGGRMMMEIKLVPIDLLQHFFIPSLFSLG